MRTLRQRSGSLGHPPTVDPQPPFHFAAKLCIFVLIWESGRAIVSGGTLVESPVAVFVKKKQKTADRCIVEQSDPSRF